MGWSSDPDASLESAVQWSERASAMDDADGQAHIIMAHVKLLRGEHKEALQIAEEAIQIRPLCANTNALYGNILVYCGQPKEAADRVKSAMRSAPVYASWWVEILAAAYRDSGLNESAISAINQLLSKKPDSANALTILISALVGSGQQEGAKDYVVALLNLEPDFTLSRHARQHPYKDQRKLEEQIASLRAVGLPE
jgi:tetratricopeptide (TPR) repeat protein